jgi:uncharacterized protein (TIGR02271 family)
MSSRNKNPGPRGAHGTVVGLFRSGSAAERAIRDLKNAGFTDNQIGVLMQDREQERKLAEDTQTKAGESAAKGAAAGGVVGGLAGLLAAVIPGVGPLVAGGALASALAGAGIGVAAGGLLGALVGMGVPEEEARYYERGVREGGILITVDAGARAAEARQILDQAGAEFGPAATVSTAGEGQERLELREEELRATKRPVEAGEVRVRKDVVAEERTMDVPVTHEEVVVERHPASGRPASGDVKEGEQIRIPVTEEEVRVEKTPVVKEEITVGKRKVQESETVRDTVRREEARIEETGAVRGRDPWKGKERRRRRDQSYAGPERRTVTS